MRFNQLNGFCVCPLCDKESIVWCLTGVFECLLFVFNNTEVKYQLALHCFPQQIRKSIKWCQKLFTLGETGGEITQKGVKDQIKMNEKWAK